MPGESPSLSDAAQKLIADIESRMDKEDIQVPLLPEVANKAVTLSQDPESDAIQLSQLIQSDPSLAAHVMRIANSAAYTPSASLVSLQQAITRLGMNLICDIAVAASVSTKMFNTPGHESHIEYIWQHALATALWSKEIARSCRLNVEATFLCGLLHSIGRPVLIQTALDSCSRLQLTISSDELYAIEDYLHMEVGSCVLKKWEMPMIICESLQYFYRYNDAPHAMEQTAIINAAADFATVTLKPETLSQQELLDREVLGDLNLYPDEVEALLDKQGDIISSMEAMTG
ncbi:HDOD domain-containing protein [Candidatus Pelagadaptatus aseana]|uniref:HDOD domain-containing protein n=1 Tax=Candidatus Pelagadaptatus aseana TaxID=3120508 RepID=UPI003C6FBEC2